MGLVHYITNWLETDRDRQRDPDKIKRSKDRTEKLVLLIDAARWRRKGGGID